jgi:phosphatidylserine/phosphatidylglycerophosphate/cardiolipin synthase-like enzyme
MPRSSSLRGIPSPITVMRGNQKLTFHLKDKLYQWAKETNNRALQFNTHVAYIHSKFLLKDPLGLEPIVVTGSANFSDDSQKENDENMIIIRGDQRVADIYFTEFNRLFNHYYFRSVMETLNAGQPPAPQEDSLMLAEDDSWVSEILAGQAAIQAREGIQKDAWFRLK